MEALLDWFRVEMYNWYHKHTDDVLYDIYLMMTDDLA